MPFSPSAACRFLDLPQVNLRNLQLHLTKNSFATAPTHLCGVALSHIIPHFVGRKLIKTSPGNIRITNEPNKVVQDIEKHFLLCHDCEELFSAKERWFANTIFNPYQEHKKTVFNYDKNLTYFIISLSWKSPYRDLEEFSCDKEFSKEILMILFRAEQTMRDYLLGKRKDIDTIENHILFFDRIKYTQDLDASQHPSIVMHRSTSSYTVYNGKTSFTISNLMGILIVTFFSMDTNECWSNTKIEIETGTIEAKNQKIVSVVGQEIQHWMNQTKEAQKNISETQQKKILEKIQALGDDIKNYPIFQDWMDDAALK